MVSYIAPTNENYGKNPFDGNGIDANGYKYYLMTLNLKRGYDSVTFKNKDAEKSAIIPIKIGKGSLNSQEDVWDEEVKGEDEDEEKKNKEFGDELGEEILSKRRSAFASTMITTGSVSLLAVILVSVS